MLLARDPNDPSKRPLGAKAGVRPTTRLFAARAVRDFGDGFVAILLPAARARPRRAHRRRALDRLAAGVGAPHRRRRPDRRPSRPPAAPARRCRAHDRDRARLRLCRGLRAAAPRRVRRHDQSLCRHGQRLRSARALGPGARGPRRRANADVRPLQPDRRPRRRRRGARGGGTRGGRRTRHRSSRDHQGDVRALCASRRRCGLLYARIPSAPPLPSAGPASALGPSRGIVIRLAALFSLDAFAGGFVVQSLLALWLFERFGMSLPAAGLFFFWTGVLSAFSFPVAAWLSRRIGLVNTMVFTHIPSSLALMLAALAPTLPLALALLLVRAALSQMLSLLICGALKIAYDLLLLVQFRQVKPPEER